MIRKIQPALTSTSTGGVARLATVFDQVRASQKDVLIVDAGDVVDGTAFINAENGAVDLNLYSYLGYMPPALATTNWP